MTDGHIRRRGKRSWELKYDAYRDPVTGRRETRYVTFRGSKAEAKVELRNLLKEVDDGSAVQPDKQTVAVYARHWLKHIAPSGVSGKTLERYRELAEKHIIPRIGSYKLQKLQADHIETLYAELRKSGRLDGKGRLSEQTVMHIHRLLSQILASAVRARKLRQSPMTAVQRQVKPKAKPSDVQVLEEAELTALLKHLKGGYLYAPVLLAASTGLRRGELLALRWHDIDLDKAELSVEQVVEQTAAGLRMKQPKTDHSRRTIALPASVVAHLREHRKAQLEHFLKLGRGRPELAFPTWDGQTRSPRAFTKEFARAAKDAGVGHVTLHGLRHTHITHLLRQRVPVRVVSERAGHANPSITLNIYAHKLRGDDEGAAEIVDRSLSAALDE